MAMGLRRAWLAVLAALVLGPALARLSHDPESAEQLRRQSLSLPPRWTPDQAAALVAGWPELPKNLALRLCARWGPPDDASPDRLLWTKRAPYEWIAVNRADDFARRAGVLEQALRYASDGQGWRSLAKLDLGVSFDPDTGLLAGSGESEEAVTLALNVAVDVIEGRRDAFSAREFYRKTWDLALSGKSSRYTRGLLFLPRRGPRRRPAVPWRPLT